jgi:SAM-dependent methyltransferase
MEYTFREEPSLKTAVTFMLNRGRPFYNWFYFKEGFSKELVDYCVDRYSLKGPVADPFCGSGTTLLAAKDRGFKAAGSDVSPLAVLVSRAKTRNYDAAELKEAFSRLRALKPEGKTEVTEQKWLRNYFYGRTLANILFYRDEIRRLENEALRDFFLLALIDTTGRVANAVKVGGSLRKVKKPPLPVKPLFINKAKRMVRDVKNFPYPKETPEPEVAEADARVFRWEDNSIGSVVTSPPYMNKIEYTSVYKIELAMFFRQQETKMRAYISDTAAEGASFAVEDAYFSDLKKVLQNLYKGMKSNGTAVFELAGGCFPDRNVEADERLASVAEDTGFSCREIVKAREIQCHRARTFKTGTVRESLVVLDRG